MSDTFGSLAPRLVGVIVIWAGTVAMVALGG